MNLQEIDKLILKYEKGETSLEEERLLRNFFSGEGVPVHLKSYREMFGFFDDEAGRTVSADFDEKFLNEIEEGKVIPITKNRGKMTYSLIGIAATIVILIGLFFQFGQNSNNQSLINDTYNDPQIAYIQARKALMAVSANLNEGVEKLSDVSEFNDGLSNLNEISTFETGVKNLEKISIMENSKKLITSK
jgi:hypothetical protein